MNMHDFTPGAKRIVEDRTVALGDEALRRLAPSIFATSPWKGDRLPTGHRYRFFPTIDVVNRLRDNGFMPTSAGQSKTRIEGKQDYTRHVVRFRHRDLLQINTVGEEVPEIVLMNAHDGTSSYRLMTGFFRLVCSNGLIVSAGNLGYIHVRHSGDDDLATKVLEGSYQIIDDVPQITAQVDLMKEQLLTMPQQIDFAKRALEIRRTSLAVEPEALIAAQRPADENERAGMRSIWRTLNAVQEHVIRGGVAGVGATGHNRRTRAVKDPTEDVRINRELWGMARELVEA